MKCVDCEKVVRPRQHYLACTYCEEVTHRCCNNSLQLDLIQYFKYKRDELSIIFRCKRCYDRIGVQYNGSVDIFKPASVDIRVSRHRHILTICWIPFFNEAFMIQITFVCINY